MTVDFSSLLSDEAKLRNETVMSIPKEEGVISLALGLPNPECFPLKGIELDIESPESGFSKTEKVSRCIESHPRELVSACQYMSSDGLAFFNDWIKNYIEQYFKPNYPDYNSLIQAGSTQSLDAIFRMLINPGQDTVLCDSLTYTCFLETCAPFRINLVSVEMDEFGFVPDALVALLSNWASDEKTKALRFPKLYYTMPTGHNPTGITLSRERRERLLEICNRFNILIIEDDPYYHLQLDDNTNSIDHIPSLLKFDTQGRVIRIDSFSKMLMPGFRVSIVTCNTLFYKKLSMHNELSIHSAAATSQLILSMIFKNWGPDGFEKWLAHLKALYSKRRDLLLKYFDEYLPGDLVTYNRPNYGMFIWINLNLQKFAKPARSDLTDSEWLTHVEDQIFKVASEKYKVILTKGHWFMQDKSTLRAGFRATFSFVDEEQMKKGSQLFGNAIAEVYNDLYKHNN